MKKLSAIVAGSLLACFSFGQDISTGLVTSYQFNGSLADSSWHGLDLTAGGTFSFVSDRFGNSSSAVQLTTAASNGTFFLGTGPNLANSSSSVAFWVRKDYVGNGSNGSWVFGLGHPAGTGGQTNEDMEVDLDYGSSIGYSFFNNDFKSSTPLTAATWYHLAFTFDDAANERNIYINGSLDSTNSFTGMFTGSNSLKMGFEGITLDDFRFYDRALSATDVSALAAVPEPETYGLIAGLIGIGAITFRRKRQAAP